MHQGRWVIITYKHYRKSIDIDYKEDGVSGAPEKHITIELDEATPESIESEVDRFSL